MKRRTVNLAHEEYINTLDDYLSKISDNEELDAASPR